MTYSHNSNNLKMTTAGAATRYKNSGGVAAKSSPIAAAPRSAPTTPATAHSNSIACSTNYHHHHHHQHHYQHSLSTSPPGSSMSSGASTASSCSSSSGGFCGSGGGSVSSGKGGFLSQRHKQQQQQRISGGWHHHQQQQQRHSPQNANHGNYNKSKHGQKQQQRDARDTQKSPPQLRSSPTAIMGGNGCASVGGGSGSGGGSGRKNRSKNNSPNALISSVGAGKTSYTINNNNNNATTAAVIPTNLTHFAGSKCFDAPAPTALPKPPEHWTLSGGSANAFIGGKLEKLAASSAGLGHDNSGAFNNALVRHCAAAAHAHSNNAYTVGACGASPPLALMRSSKRNLLDDFDTHNLKLLLNVQS